MANKQSIPSSNLKGVFIKDDLRSVPIPVEKRREFAGNGTVETLSLMVGASGELLNKKRDYEIEKRKIQIDQDLYNYRQRLNDAKNPEEFMDISKGMETDLRDKYQGDFWGKEFWDLHGKKIVEANASDVEKIRQNKQIEFGKKSLNEMLALNQNILVNSSADKANFLLAKAVDEIDNSVFLSDEEKKTYRDGYLKTGIVNLALNDDVEALSQAKKYFDNDQNLIAEINETRKLKEKVWQQKNEEEKHQKHLSDITNITSLWQEKARGNISDAEFFVLTRDINKNLIWGDRENRSNYPLIDVYKLVKKMNGGERLSYDEVELANNHIISAFNQKQIGVQDAISWQNQIFMGQMDKNSSELVFDNRADELADLVFMEDVEYDEKMSDEASKYMEQKAKLSFDIYENYYGKKMALTENFQAMGGTVTPAMERKFARQAIEETRDELGLKQNVGDRVSFSELNQILKKQYAEVDSNVVWKRFYNFAPYVENKKEFFRTIASEERRKVLNYPYFESLDEVENAGLNIGDKFYFNGRLATKS